MPEEIPLPFPANATVTGPKLTHDGSTLLVEYDYEQNDGSIVWGTLTFEGVLAIEYRSSASSEPDQISDATHMRRTGDSPWLQKIRQRWEKTVGWQSFEQRNGGSDRFSHYHIYFDDAACIDVVAEQLKLGRRGSAG